MATRSELMSAGLPGAAADMLGSEVDTGVVATGTAQASAYPLLKALTVFGTVASGTGALLPPAGGKGIHVVVNGGASLLAVYPSSGQSINAGSANTSVSVSPNRAGLFVPAGVKWIYFQGGIDDITATAAEINAIAGGGLSAAELAVLEGVTAGTALASKALVVDANKDLASLRHLTVTGNLVRASRSLLVPAWFGKAGATAGWVVTGADDGLARLPAGQTASTLVLPITGLHVGDIVTGAGVVGQVESGGNNVTCTLSLRKQTAAAADITDAELATDNVGTLTADTILSAANLGVTGLTETMAADESLYALITATTAAATDIAIMGLIVSLTQN